MYHAHDQRHAALIVILSLCLIGALTATAVAGMSLDLGNPRADWAKQLSERYDVSYETAYRMTNRLEEINNARVLDKWNIEEGTILDYFSVDQKRTDGPVVSYDGSSAVCLRNSRLGQAYLKKVYSELSLIERINRWFVDILSPNRHLVMVPMGMLGPAQASQVSTALTGAPSTRRVAVIGAIFPAWIDRSPGPGQRYQLAAQPPDADIREYPMANNGAVEHEWSPAAYADSPGGPMSNGEPQGLTYPTTNWPQRGNQPGWGDAEFANRWWDTLFNRSNPNSMTQFYYYNSHANATFEGERDDIYGWWHTHHKLDRYRGSPLDEDSDVVGYEPGTPIIRPVDDDDGTFEIVRASLTGNALTILFERDVDSRPGITLRAEQPEADDESPATVVINVASSDWRLDPYDHRRHTWVNDSGWEYEDLDSGNDEDFEIWSGHNWEVTSQGDTWDNSNIHWRAQNRGCNQLPNTTYDTSDVYVTSAGHEVAWDAYESQHSASDQMLFGSGVAMPDGYDAAFGNRLHCFDYYVRDHNPNASDAPYQIQHLENSAGYIDDIGGTRVRSTAPRPYPFDLGPNDPPNDGFSSSGYRGAAGMRADVTQVMLDHGVDLSGAGYDSMAFLFPTDGADIIPHASGGVVYLPETPNMKLAAHEFGHALFGFTDLYDHDFYNKMENPDTQPPHDVGLAIGPYSLYGGGEVGGFPLGRLDAWNKINTGWVTPQVVQDDQVNLSIPAIDGSPSGEPIVYKIPANPYYIVEQTDPGLWQEYYLVENRSKMDGDYFGDEGVPGLYIYHVDRRDIHYRARARTPFQVCERAYSVAMVQADGLDELSKWGTPDSPNLHDFTTATPQQKEQMVLGDPFPYREQDGGPYLIRDFDQLPEFIGQESGEPPQYSAKTWSHGDVNTTPDTTVIVPDTPTDNFARVVNISDPGSTMRADIFVEPREVIVTDATTDPTYGATIANTLADGDDVPQQDPTDDPLGFLALKLDNPEYNGTDYQYMSKGDVVIDDIRFRESGTSDWVGDPETGHHPAIDEAFLYAETSATPDGFQPDLDSVIGSGSLQHIPSSAGPDPGTFAVFEDLGYRVPLNETRHLYLAYTIREDAQLSPQIGIGAEITEYSYIEPQAPGAVQLRERLGPKWQFGDHRFPIAGKLSTVVDNGDDVTVTPNPDPPAANLPTNLEQGGSNVPVLHLKLEADEDEVIFNTVKVHAPADSGTYDQPIGDITSVRLYEDSNGNGVRDGGEPQLASGNFQNEADPVAELSLLDLDDMDLRTVRAGEPTYWLVTLNIAGNATLGHVTQIQLNDNVADLVITQPQSQADDDEVLPDNFPIATPDLTIVQPNEPPNPPDAGFNPQDGATISDTTPTLSWTEATDNLVDPTDPTTGDDPDDLYYEVELAEDASFNTPVAGAGGSTAQGVTSYDVPVTLDLGTYYWRVWTVDTDGARSEDPSVVLEFTITENEPPNPPVGDFDPDSVDPGIVNQTPRYLWPHATDPDTNDTWDTLMYDIQVDDNDDFSSPVVDQADLPVPGGVTVDDRVYYDHGTNGEPNLTPGVTYYWHVRTYDGDARSDWSAVEDFRVVENTPPYAPIAGEPESADVPDEDDEINTSTPTYNWRSRNPADINLSDRFTNDPFPLKYRVQVVEYENTFADGPFVIDTGALGAGDLTIDTDNYTVAYASTTALTDNVHYKWRVRAQDSHGAWSDWSDTQSFWVNIDNQPPNVVDAGFDPNNGESVADDTPVLRWQHATDPDPSDHADNLAYVVELSKVGDSQANFTANVAYQYTTAGNGASQITVTETLEDLTTWYWRIKTVDDDGAASGDDSPPTYSDIQEFFVDTENVAAVLSEPEDGPMIDPMYGGRSTFYEYRIRYSDDEGDAPGVVKVVIDPGTPAEQELEMSLVDPNNPNYRQGEEFRVGITGTDLGDGQHYCYFQADTNNARYPAQAPDEVFGPVVGTASDITLTNSSWVEKDVYEEHHIVYVQLDDDDQDLDAGAQDTIEATVRTESGSDYETVTLTEDGTNSGIFQGQIPIRGAVGSVEDGELNVIAEDTGKTIIAEYTDPDDINNPSPNPDPDYSRDEAQVVDTKAPDPVTAAMMDADSGPHGRSVNLTWDTYDEPTQIDVDGYRVYYSDSDPGAGATAGDMTLYSIVEEGNLGVTVAGLEPNTEYFFAVVPIDEVPNPSPAGAVPVETVSLTTRDTTAPTITNLIPADGQTEVPLDTGISCHVADQGVGVDIGTLDVDVTVNGSSKAVSVETTDQGTYYLVEITPNSPFEWNDSVTVEVSVSEDDPYSVQSRTEQWSFDVLADTVDPTVEEQNPADGDTGVNVTQTISFHLKDNKSGIDLSTLSVTLNGAAITGEVTTTEQEGTLDVLVTYTPDPDLQYSRTYTVAVSVQDVADNDIGPVEWSFDTAIDDTGVIFDNFNPERGADNVPIESNISLRATDAEAGVEQNSIRMWVDGSEVTGNLNLTPQNGAIEISYNPPGDLPYSTQVSVKVYAADEVGNEETVEYSFTVEDPPDYIISGSVMTAADNPVVGATITVTGTDFLGGDVNRTVTTDGNGSYLMTNIIEGDYTVTPTKDEWRFDPTSRDISPGPDDAAGVNFTGTLITHAISGRVVNRAGDGVAGVSISYGTDSVTTEDDGTFLIDNLRRGEYTLTPSKQYFHFDPVNRVVAVVDADVTGRNFTAIPDTFEITGTVEDADGNRIQGVEVTNGDSVAITNEAGVYTMSNIPMGTHMVSADKVGYQVLPAPGISYPTQDDAIEVTVPPDASGVDFVAHVEISNSFAAGIHMIGVPGTPIDPDPVNVFGTTSVARWDSSSQPPAYLMAVQYRNNAFMQVQPGSGYFVKYNDAHTTAIAAQPTDASRPVSIGLGVDWNMIANPFATPTPFGNFQPTVAGGTRPFAFVYNTQSGSYDLVSSKPAINAARSYIEPWEGAWVLAESGGTSLTVTADTQTASVRGVQPQQVDVGDGYTIPVIASANGRSDTCSVAGVLPGRADEHVLPNPPKVPGSVDVYFVGDDNEHLSRDIRNASEGTDIYDFVVTSDVGTAEVTVALPDLTQVPHRYQVMLRDLDAGKTVYARTMQAYTYTSSDRADTRRFRLTVEPRTVGGLVVSTTAAEQAGETAVVTYNVSQTCQVTMRIMNMAGRSVRVLATDTPVSAGVNSMAWNLRNDAGAKVPAGMYLVEIQAETNNGQQARGLAKVMLRR